MNDLFLTAMPYKGTIYIHIPLYVTWQSPHWHKEGGFFSFGPMVVIWISFARYPKLHRQYWTRKSLACWWRSVCFIITEQSYGGFWSKTLKKTNRLLLVSNFQLPCNFCSSTGCNWFWKGNQGPLCNCGWRAWGCSKRWWGIQDSKWRIGKTALDRF